MPQQAYLRVQQWALTLAAYEYKIAYKTRTTNANADALGRLPLFMMPESVPVQRERVLLLRDLDPTPNSSCHISENGRGVILYSQKSTSLHLMDGHTMSKM